MPECKTCAFFNKQSNFVELPDGSSIEQLGFVLYATKQVAKCVEPANFWENITRDVSTADLFNDAEKRSVFEHSGLIGVGELDVCPLYTAQLVEEIVVTSDSGFYFVEPAANLSFIATVSPDNAVDSSVTWSVIAGTGTASIDGAGTLTGTTVGSITVRATANDGSGIIGEVEVNVVELVTSITVTGQGGATMVGVGADLQMLAAILPVTATDQTIRWTVINGTGLATINEFTGLLTGALAGTVTVRATAQDGSTVYGETVISVV